MYSTRRTSGSHPLIPPDPALSPPASVLPPPASVLVPPDSPFLHRRIPDSRFIVAPRAPHITIQFLQGKGSLDLFSLDLPLPASYVLDPGGFWIPPAHPAGLRTSPAGLRTSPAGLRARSAGLPVPPPSDPVFAVHRCATSAAHYYTVFTRQGLLRLVLFGSPLASFV
ncbi:hypothetical protein LshimejAT787_0202340 [Lyophyllum shimeji]|uniref:Uncharacterized protein n=1 Tax=Lyophyllum shimeji TaxID=47721 RepID=A0A9P3PFP7_LYOSH|nr:hypothetical protein LshimejAT787_0202340 [Lyophyllum shimeji]